MWDKLVRKAARKEVFSGWKADFHLCPEYIEFGQSKFYLVLVASLVVMHLLIELTDLKAQGHIDAFRLHHYMMVWQVKVRASRRGASSARANSWQTWRFPSDLPVSILQLCSPWRLHHMKEYVDALVPRL